MNNEVKTNTVIAINIQIEGITEKAKDALPDNPCNLLINKLQQMEI